jgi:Predicted phosphatases
MCFPLPKAEGKHIEYLAIIASNILITTFGQLKVGCTMNYSHVLWDFNGTLLNDVKAGIQSANVLLRRRNLKTIDSVDDYRAIFCFPIIQYYKQLGLDLEKEAFNDLAEEWMEQYLRFSKQADLFDGVLDVLSHIKELNISQVMLSATEKNMLSRQLDEYKLNVYFDQILGLENIHAYSKVDIAKEWKDTVNPIKAVMIGDTVHDFEVASEIGIKCILIANGHQGRKVLNNCNVPVLNSIKDLLQGDRFL